MSRTDQLPAVLPSGAIAPAASVDTDIVPALVAASGHDAIDRFLNFFATQIENDNTREALSSRRARISRLVRAARAARVGLDPTVKLVANSMTGSGSHLQGGKV
jgi:hypothetical protein